MCRAGVLQHFHPPRNAGGLGASEAARTTSVPGQVTSIVHQGPSGVLQSLDYTYDDDGQRTRIVREDNTRIYYTYDAAHRLTGENWLDPSDVHLYAFAYDYDAAGNRLKKTFNGEVTYYTYNNLNQLETEAVLGGGATYYTWTADGETATKQEAAGVTGDRRRSQLHLGCR